MFLAFSLEINSLVFIYLTFLEPLQNTIYQALQIVERLRTECNLEVLCGEILCYFCHSGNLLLCYTEFVLYFYSLRNAARLLLGCDLKSAVFVDRESAHDYVFLRFHGRQCKVKMTNLIVVSHRFVFTLKDSDAEILLPILAICVLSRHLAWNGGVCWNDNTHKATEFLDS